MLFLSFDERWNLILNNDVWGFFVEFNCWYICGWNLMGFYILFFKEEVLFLNYLNRVIWFIVILYMYYFDENINKLYNFNIVIRLNVLYEWFFLID